MLDRIALILVVIGAINWGSIGLFQFDIVAWAFGGQGSRCKPRHLHDCRAGGYLVHLPVLP